MGRMPDRAFHVETDADDDLLTAVLDAQREGRLPPVRLGERLIGAAQEDDLAFVDVSGDQLRQLASGRRLPRWVAAKNPLSGGYVETRALTRRLQSGKLCPAAPHELSTALAGVVVGRMRDYLTALTEEVWRLERQVTSGYLGDPEKFLEACRNRSPGRAIIQGGAYVTMFRTTAASSTSSHVRSSVLTTAQTSP